MRIGIPKEIRPGERRVAATPDTVEKLRSLGFEVAVQASAGAGAAFSDQQYRDAGASIVAKATELWANSDAVLKVQPPAELPEPNEGKSPRHEADLLREGATLISFLWPAKNQAIIERLVARKATVFAVDQIPRITRAQKMDALSSMANIAGYRAVIEAANCFGRFFTGQVTAAGKIPPAKVLVIGAGVAGLAAIGTARGLGAVVRAFDTRPAVKEQVKSMGAEVLELDIAEDGTGEGGYAKTMSPEFIQAEIDLFHSQAEDIDIIITTALIPGKRAPVLLTEDVVKRMKPGSVIVDLAAEAGGNCAVTSPGELVTWQGVNVIGFVDLPSRLAPTASQLYGTNLYHLLADLGGAEKFHIDREDEVVAGALVVHQGEMTWPPKRKPAPAPQPKAKPNPKSEESRPAPAPPAAPAPHSKATPKESNTTANTALLTAAVVLAALGMVAPQGFLSHLTVFVLACFVGWQVIWHVTPALHTPLMSVTNAISGIILIGGMLQVSGPSLSPVTLLGAVAVLIATINIAGGFLVTQRMLKMFQK